MISLEARHVKGAAELLVPTLVMVAGVVETIDGLNHLRERFADLSTSQLLLESVKPAISIGAYFIGSYAHGVFYRRQAMMASSTTQQTSREEVGRW